MKRLIIMAAGGCGREVLQWALDCNEKTPRWDFFGFLDYDKHILDGKNTVAKIIGNDEDYEIQENDEFVCAVGNGALREKIIDKMEKRGAHFIDLVHPTAVVARSAVLEGGVIVYPYSLITADTSVGKGCIINMNCSIAHDVKMGAYCNISPNCDISGMCTIGRNVFMGVGSHIIPSIKVGDNAFICAGSVVMTKVAAGAKMIGNPAKRVRAW